MGKGKRNKLNKLLKEETSSYEDRFFTKFDSSLNDIIDSIIDRVLDHEILDFYKIRNSCSEECLRYILFYLDCVVLGEYNPSDFSDDDYKALNKLREKFDRNNVEESLLNDVSLSYINNIKIRVSDYIIDEVTSIMLEEIEKKSKGVFIRCLSISSLKDRVLVSFNKFADNICDCVLSIYELYNFDNREQENKEILSIYQYVYTLLEYNNDANEISTPSELPIVEESQFIYIPSYKDLNSLALNNGFDLIRIKGDHGIFKNASNGLTIVIPQGRDVGKGLSIKIQKDIAKYSVI